MIYSGQGPIFIGDWDTATNRIINQKQIGCGNRTLKVELNRSTEKIKESCSGARATLAEYETEKDATLTLDMQQFDRATLANALYGTTAVVAGGTVAAGTPEELPTVLVGDFVHLNHLNVSALNIVDSAATSAPLVLGTHYVLESAEHGRIKFINLGGFTQPFKANYAFASYGNIAALTQSGLIKALVFDGKSTVDSQNVRVIIPQVSLSPTAEFNWLSDEPATLGLTGSILFTQALAGNSLYGGFMRVDMANANG